MKKLFLLLLMILSMNSYGYLSKYAKTWILVEGFDESNVYGIINGLRCVVPKKMIASRLKFEVNKQNKIKIFTEYMDEMKCTDYEIPKYHEQDGDVSEKDLLHED